MQTVEPVFDTWSVKKEAAEWCICPSFSFNGLNTLQINLWYVDCLKVTLDCFEGLVRPHTITFNAPYQHNLSVIVLVRDSGSSTSAYLERVVASIIDFPAPLEFLKIEVDIFAWSRTTESPHKPTKAWMRLPSKFTFLGGPDNDPNCCFKMSHTLFRPYSKDADDNTELYRLNSCLLESALRAWERALGEIEETTGLTGIRKYGFVSPEEQLTEYI